VRGCAWHASNPATTRPFREHHDSQSILPVCVELNVLVAGQPPAHLDDLIAPSEQR